MREVYVVLHTTDPGPDGSQGEVMRHLLESVGLGEEIVSVRFPPWSKERTAVTHFSLWERPVGADRAVFRYASPLQRERGGVVLLPSDELTLAELALVGPVTSTEPADADL